jgi:DNA-binding beta-propeller fold protein YncE
MMSLRLRTTIDVPPGQPGGFDHADVHEASGLVYVAHTAFDAVEMIDGPGARHVAMIPGCPEASGVASAPDLQLIFAAARGTGEILVLDAPSGRLIGELSAGFRPNGCAWNPNAKQLLAADVQDNQARIIDIETGALVSSTLLPGRPRWAAYESDRQRFLINILDPACVAVVGEDGGIVTAWPVAAEGPHGMAVDVRAKQVFIACDGAELVTLSLDTGNELFRHTIAGPPDVLWYNFARSLLYVAIGNPGVVQVIHTPSMRVVQEVPTERGAHTLTFDQSRQLLHVFLPQRCAVAVYEEQDEEDDAR